MGASKKADIEAWETALRAAVLSAGAKVLEQLLQGIGSGREPWAIVCKCGARMQSPYPRTEDHELEVGITGRIIGWDTIAYLRLMQAE